MKNLPLKGPSRRTTLAGLCLAPIASLVRAQPDYPDRPITIYLPVAPGGALDVIMRLAASIVSSILKQPVLVETRPGGNTAVGTQALVRAKPNGYTVGVIGSVQFLLPFTENVSFDPLRDLTYIIGLYAFASGAVVRADSKYRTFADLVQAARAQPGKIAIGTGGSTTPGGVAIRYFEKEHGISFLQVPFRGADANVALLGGHIDSAWGGPAWTAQVSSGQFRLLTTFSERRAPRFPNVPTARELGYPLTQVATVGICGPAGMDPRIVHTLHDAFRQVLINTDFQKLSTDFLSEEWYKSTVDFEAWAKAEFDANRALARDLGLKRAQ